MYSKKQLLLTLPILFVWLCLISPQSLWAQNVNPGSKSEEASRHKMDSLKRGQGLYKKSRIYSLGEVVITASKFPKKLSEIGKVVDIIGKNMLAESEGKSISTLLNEVPGIHIDASNSNPGQNKSIYLQGALANYTLILIDGIPVTDPSLFGATFDIRLLNLDQFERIEILKGGQSTLYGTDAVAGVFNFITKRAETLKPQVSALFSGGSYGTFRENLGISQKIAPNIEYLANYTHYKTNGVSEAFDNGIDTVNKGHFHKDGLIQDAINLSTRFGNEKISISPYLRYSSISGLFANNAFLDGINPYYSKNLSAGFGSKYEIKNGGSFVLSEGYTYSKSFYNYEGYPSTYTGRFNQGELFYEKNIGANLQILAGISYQNNQLLDTSSASIRKNPSIVILSPYASVFLNHFHNFNFVVGGRLNHNSSYGNNFTYNLNPSYQLLETLKLFLDYATSFRAPSLTELYGNFGANPKLKPETSQSWEGGLSGFIPISDTNFKRLDFRLLAFQRRIHEAINFYSNKYVNEYIQNDRGLEFTASGKISERFGFGGSYSIITGMIKTKSPNNGLDTSYNNLIRRPKNTLGLNLSYKPLERLLFTVSYQSYANRFDEDFNTGNYIRLPDYELVNVYAQLIIDNKKRIKIFGQFNNIFNRSFTEIIGYTTLKFNFNAGVSVRL